MVRMMGERPVNTIENRKTFQISFSSHTKLEWLAMELWCWYSPKDGSRRSCQWVWFQPLLGWIYVNCSKICKSAPLGITEVNLDSVCLVERMKTDGQNTLNRSRTVITRWDGRVQFQGKNRVLRDNYPKWSFSRPGKGKGSLDRTQPIVRSMLN